MTGLALVDHHVHGILTGELDAAAIEHGLMESTAPPPPGTTAFDTQLGFAVRRWCAPVLDLEPLAPADDYLRRRLELGSTEAARRFLTAAAVDLWLIDTGYQTDAVTTPAELVTLSGTRSREVARLESVAARLVQSGVTAAGYAGAVASAVHDAAASAVGFKTVAAYRGGLALDPARPAPAEVANAAGRWLREIDAGAPARLEDKILIRHGIWAALDTGLPLQFHTGFGDTDSRLARSDPALLHDFLLASQPTGTAVMLLHCYPYHRQAAALANLFPHVYMDVGEALNHVGARSAAVLAEALELTPFHKMLYSSDAFGLPELHYLGAVGFRRDIATVTSAFVTDTLWSAADASRVADMIGSVNAQRVYKLSAS
ncbi:MAG TPA: amidohydrolase family protein [Streptosporangiaceae bacterium]|nr:amidohydrolase family protein [Streptosporangiaceae bacterium]